MTRPFLPLCTLLLLLAPAACGDMEARDHAQRYQLVRTGIGDLPLPLAQRQGCAYTLIGGEVVLDPAEARYTSVLAVRQQCADEARGDTVLNRGTMGTYEPLGDSLVFLGAAGDTSGVGTLRNDTLRLQGPLHTLVFVRGDTAGDES